MSGEECDVVVSQAMLDEEKRLENQTEKENTQLASEAKKEFDSVGQDQRWNRLNTLLDRSSLYTDFLYNKMKAQKEEKPKEKKKDKEKDKDKSKKGKRKSEEDSKEVEKRSKTAKSDSAMDTSADKAGNTGEEEEDGSWMTKSGERASHRQPRLLSGACLREYQLAGVEWMTALFENGLNGILADEMGLGKTVQSIGFLAHLHQHKVKGPYLIVAPLSTLGNWMREFHTWAPDIKAILYHGTQQDRAVKRKELSVLSPVTGCYPTIVTSYEIVMNDRKFLQKYKWQYIIVDEGHRLKNLNCRLIKELKRYDSANRLLLTGTPLQNNLAELWSLLNFLLPDIFDDIDSFQRWFDFGEVDDADGEQRIVAKEQENSVLTKLHNILQPFLLRRLKTDVEVSIPPKKEIVLYAPLTAEQEAMYDSLLDKTFLEKKQETPQEAPQYESGRQGRAAALNKSYKELTDEEYFAQLDKEEAEAEEEKNKRKRMADDKRKGEDGDKDKANSSADGSEEDKEDGAEEEEGEEGGEEEEAMAASGKSLINTSLRNIVMQLRKCCNHPYLIEYPLTSDGELCINEDLVRRSGKLLLLDRLLPPLKAEGHKVLIFSQMTQMLDILQDYCWLRGYRYCRLDGNVSYEERKKAIDDFNKTSSRVVGQHASHAHPSVEASEKEDDMFIFLLSTRAGGLGINLVSADTCIIYDSDWNPQSDLQAQDRCHRIGQKNPVLVYRLITANTVDQRILERAEAKRKLEKMVMHKNKFKGRGKDTGKSLSPKELRDLLHNEDAEKIVFQDRTQVISDEELVRVLDRTGAADKVDDGKGARFRVIDEVPAQQSSTGLF